MPQLDIFIWFDTLLTTNNLFIGFVVLGVTASFLIVRRGVGTGRFWPWRGQGCVLFVAFPGGRFKSKSYEQPIYNKPVF